MTGLAACRAALGALLSVSAPTVESFDAGRPYQQVVDTLRAKANECLAVPGGIYILVADATATGENATNRRRMPSTTRELPAFSAKPKPPHMDSCSASSGQLMKLTVETLVDAPVAYEVRPLCRPR